MGKRKGYHLTLEEKQQEVRDKQYAKALKKDMKLVAQLVSGFEEDFDKDGGNMQVFVRLKNGGEFVQTRLDSTPLKENSDHPSSPASSSHSRRLEDAESCWEDVPAGQEDLNSADEAGTGEVARFGDDQGMGGNVLVDEWRALLEN